METNPPASARESKVRELSEDIRVAILEFLERHPRTSRDEILEAMRVVERSTAEVPPPQTAHFGKHSCLEPRGRFR